MSFDYFVAQHRAQLRRFATALTGQPWLADDLLADVLGRAYERWATVSAADDVLAYVRKMIVNDYLAWHRRLRRTSPVAGFVDHISTHTDGSQGRADRDELKALVRRLPRKQRAVVVLRFYYDLPHDEIAGIMGSSVTTVRSNLSRALRSLRIASQNDAALQREIQSAATTKG